MKLEEKVKKENIFMIVGEVVDFYVRVRIMLYDMCWYMGKNVLR